MHRVEPLSEGFTIPAVFASHHKSSHKTLQLFAAQIWEHPPETSRYQREPRQARGEHAESTQKGPGPGLNL